MKKIVASALSLSFLIHPAVAQDPGRIAAGPSERALAAARVAVDAASAPERFTPPATFRAGLWMAASGAGLFALSFLAHPLLPGGLLLMAAGVTLLAIFAPKGDDFCRWKPRACGQIPSPRRRGLKAQVDKLGKSP